MDQPAVVTAVMLDTVDLARAERFWSTFLGLKVVHREDPYVYLDRLTAGGPRLALQRVPEPKAGKKPDPL